MKSHSGFFILIYVVLTLSVRLTGQTLTFRLDSLCQEQGDTVVMPITVDSFTVIAGYQGTIRWDSTVLDFLEITSPNPLIFSYFGEPGVGLVPLDGLTFTGVDPTGLGQTIPDGSVVMEIHFQVKPNAPFGSTEVRIDSSVTLLGYTHGSALLTPIVRQGEIKVLDPLAPVARCQDFDLYLDSMGEGMLFPVDLDSGSTVSFGPASYWLSEETLDCSDIGDQSVILYVSDANGATDSCFSLVHIIDSIAPVMICQDISISLDSNGVAMINPAMIDGGSTDACGILDFSLSQDSFGIGDLGQQMITLSGMDSSGNMAECVALLTVESATTDIEEEGPFSEFTELGLFPNPVDARLQVIWRSPWNGPLSLSILNPLGQIIRQESFIKNETSLDIEIDVQDLASGWYFIQIQQEGHIQHRRLIKN